MLPRVVSWDHAVRYLPSLNTPTIRAWVRRYPQGPDGPLVTPCPGFPPALLLLPHRELSVPQSEYELFLAAPQPGTTAPIDAAGPARPPLEHACQRRGRTGVSYARGLYPGAAR